MNHYNLGDIFADQARIIDIRPGGLGIVYICEGRLYELEGTFAIKTIKDMGDPINGSISNHETVKQRLIVFLPA
jgi:hypothetical protein